MQTYDREQFPTDVPDGEDADDLEDAEPHPHRP
jgi:hypothetical protein